MNKSSLIVGVGESKFQIAQQAVFYASCSWASTFCMNGCKLPICKCPSAVVADGNPRSFAAWHNRKHSETRWDLTKFLVQKHII